MPEPTEEKLSYRLVTGPDTREFCERISAALAEGYVLHGSPAATFNGDSVIVAQAVVLPAAIASCGRRRRQRRGPAWRTTKTKKRSRATHELRR